MSSTGRRSMVVYGGSAPTPGLATPLLAVEGRSSRTRATVSTENGTGNRARISASVSWFCRQAANLFVPSRDSMVSLLGRDPAVLAAVGPEETIRSLERVGGGGATRHGKTRSQQAVARGETRMQVGLHASGHEALTEAGRGVRRNTQCGRELRLIAAVERGGSGRRADWPQDAERAKAPGHDRSGGNVTEQPDRLVADDDSRQKLVA